MRVRQAVSVACDACATNEGGKELVVLCCAVFVRTIYLGISRNELFRVYSEGAILSLLGRWLLDF